MSELALFLTGDGSHSLRSQRFGVSYHSTHGALQESRHIFIDAGLQPLLTDETATLRILEMGFGTGLNALLVRLVARQYPRTSFDYTSYEQYPITSERARSLNYPQLLSLETSDLLQLHDAPWGEVISLEDNFTFTKRREDFLSIDGNSQRPYDLIFYDAFAPETQPDLWTEAAMQVCAQRLRPGGTLVTYCAKGQFKRSLRAAGFTVEALPGPIGKREITRATLSACEIG